MSLGRRGQAMRSTSARPAMPDTIMGHAFLRALLVWLERQAGSRDRVTLPTGRVDGDELRQVLTALICARRGQQGRAS